MSYFPCYVPVLIRIYHGLSHLDVPARCDYTQLSTVSQNCIFNTAEEKATHLVRRRLGKVRKGQQEGEAEQRVVIDGGDAGAEAVGAGRPRVTNGRSHDDVLNVCPVQSQSLREYQRQAKLDPCI